MGENAMEIETAPQAPSAPQNESLLPETPVKGSGSPLQQPGTQGSGIQQLSSEERLGGSGFGGFGGFGSFPY